jgi:lipopolysaccharide transport system ATP-binding protein
MSVVIQVDRLSKQYRLGTIGGKRLVDDVNRWWASFRGREDPLSKIGTPKRAETGNLKPETAEPQVSGLRPQPSPSDTIYALRDVSFEVKQGEVLGIIGRNGAGKSTLLKILSRVTAPTSGEVRVKGRIASLLEVGTGFHPELTGRENIYLNGAILGMTKSEIRRKFDEIVAFSEVEQFIDTPVKRYSSGMTVRLAFAVAAHLEPEILIVDEVLAVGDAAFQRKCLGKMHDVAGEGRTVLFVSHNMAAVDNLCSTCVYLSGGRLMDAGETKHIIASYLSKEATDNLVESGLDLPDDPVLQLHTVELMQNGNAVPFVFTNAPIEIILAYTVKKSEEGLRIGFDLCAADGMVIWRAFDDDVAGPETSRMRPGHYHAACLIPANLLAEQYYEVRVIAGIHMKRWITRGEVKLGFSPRNVGGVNSDYAEQKRPGVLMPQLSWTITQAQTHQALEQRP